MGSLQLSLHFNNSNIFSPGEALVGKVLITSLKETLAEHIYVSFIGKVKVNFNTANYGALSFAAPNSYTACENLLKDSITLGGNSPVVIPIGYTEYEFSYVLPNKLPSSLSNSRYGSIVYYAVAGIKQRGFYSPTETPRQPFTVQAILDLNNDPEAKVPLVKNVNTALGKGTVIMAITSPQSGYVLGENIPLTIDINNQSKKNIEASVCLQRKTSFYGKPAQLIGRNFTQSKEEYVQIALVHSPKIESGDRLTWSVPDLMVPEFTINLSMPSSENRESGIIIVQYELKVKICSQNSQKSKLEIPLIIGTKSGPQFSLNQSTEKNSKSKDESNLNESSNQVTFTDESNLPPPSYDEVMYGKK